MVLRCGSLSWLEVENALRLWDLYYIAQVSPETHPTPKYADTLSHSRCQSLQQRIITCLQSLIWFSYFLFALSRTAFLKLVGVWVRWCEVQLMLHNSLAQHVNEAVFTLRFGCYFTVNALLCNVSFNKFRQVWRRWMDLRLSHVRMPCLSKVCGRWAFRNLLNIALLVCNKFCKERTTSIAPILQYRQRF